MGYPNLILKNMKLTLLLIPLILLSSCTIDWNDEKDAKIVGLEKQIQEIKNDDSFKRNQECANLAPELSKQVNELNIKNRNMNPGR